MGQSIGIIGAGSWGTAVAVSLARGGRSVEMWAIEKDVVDSINNEHENKMYLPGFTLSQSITASNDIKKVAKDKEFLILASPSLFLSKTVESILDIPNIKDGSTTIGILTKGFIPSAEGPKLIVETLEDILPKEYKGNLVYISGPSHAEEVAEGKVTGLIAASENPRNSIRFREVLKSKGLLVYSSLDVIGVQICAAAKNVVAIGFGCFSAIAENSNLFGDNTESLLLAAGLNEIMTIGNAMGATHPETFTSIAGVGDLDVTCRSAFGRNQKFGKDIINKNILEPFNNVDDLISRISEVGYLPEGVVACKFIAMLAKKENIKLPICLGLYRILNKEIEPSQFVEELIEGVEV